MLKTERRKKYAEEVSLYSPGSAEAKIYSALNEKTKFEFADTALSDVVDYIKQKHEIEVQLDNKGLADAAVDPSAPITRSVDGISLRSALRLILEDLDSLINDKNRSFFLNQLDGLENNDGLLVIGSTNHYDRLDPAITKRPSRFDRKLFVPFHHCSHTLTLTPLKFI